jgi:hypothetical protein
VNFRIIAISAMLVVPEAIATADPITVFDDSRATFVLAHVKDASGEDRHTAVDERADFVTGTVSASTRTSSGLSTATVISSISNPAHMSGIGSAEALWSSRDVADFSTDAEFAVGFHLASPMTYQFDGTFTTSGIGEVGASDEPLGESRGAWDTFLGNQTNGSAVFRDSGTDLAATRSFSGLLLPGDYGLVVEATGLGFIFRGGSTDDVRGAFNFTFDLAPVGQSPSPTPEPASLLLVSTGAISIVGGLRRRRR